MKHDSHPNNKKMIANKIITFLCLNGEMSLHSKKETLTQILPKRDETWELFHFNRAQKEQVVVTGVGVKKSTRSSPNS